jgi:threonyl-tRNA synthetase
MSLPERFDLSYVGQDNEKHRPIMIHRVVFGSVERFFGILVEHFAGKFPLWLSPVQAVVLPINDDLAAYAGKVRADLEQKGLRIEIDDRKESLNRKIRDAQLQNIPLILTIGQKEKDAGTLSVRTLDGKVQYGVSPEVLTAKILSNVKDRRMDLDTFSP